MEFLDANKKIAYDIWSTYFDKAEKLLKENENAFKFCQESEALRNFFEDLRDASVQTGTIGDEIKDAIIEREKELREGTIKGAYHKITAQAIARKIFEDKKSQVPYDFNAKFYHIAKTLGYETNIVIWENGSTKRGIRIHVENPAIEDRHTEFRKA